MPPSVSGSGFVPYGHEPLLGDSRGEYAARRTCKRTLLHSVKGLWNTMVSAMEHVPEEKFRLGNTSRNLDLSARRSCKTVTHAPLGTIAAMSGAPSKPKTLSHATKRVLSLRLHTPRDVRCPSGMPIRRWPQRQGDLRFERNRSPDVAASAIFRRAFVNKSSSDPVEVFTARRSSDANCNAYEFVEPQRSKTGTVHDWSMLRVRKGGA